MTVNECESELEEGTWQANGYPDQLQCITRTILER